MIRRVEIIDKRKYTAAVLNADGEIFVVYIAALVELTTLLIYSSCQAQVAILTSEKNGISAEYSEFSNIFSSNSAVELPEYIGIYDHSINLLDDKQLLYSPIYSLGPVELEILKTYIKANLASGFIKPSKSSANTLILFIQKKDDNLRLCVNHQGLNNLIIKNHHLLLLIGESLNCLSCNKHFTQLDLTNAYY